MLSKNLIFFIAIPLTIYGKNILINDDPNLDYVFHDNEGSGDASEPVITSKPFNGSELEVEENIIDSGLPSVTLINDSNNESPDKPNSSVTTQLNSDNSKCSSDSEKIAEKINEILKKYIPETLKLKPIKRGNFSQIILDDGRLSVNKDYKLIGQPICTQTDDQKKKYDLTLSFNDLMGFYNWKIFNLFGYNFSESALITIKQIITELIVTEDIEKGTKLVDIKIGKIEDLKVKVNIPQRLSTISFLKPMLEYVISRISTNVANRSMDSIVKNLRDIFYDSIQDKLSIKP